MLIFGAVGRSRDRETPFPEVRFELAVPDDPGEVPVLHHYGCDHLLRNVDGAGVCLRQTVSSTTYDEISEYATRQYGEEGWAPCRHCGV